MRIAWIGGYCCKYELMGARLYLLTPSALELLDRSIWCSLTGAGYHRKIRSLEGTLVSVLRVASQRSPIFLSHLEFDEKTIA